MSIFEKYEYWLEICDDDLSVAKLLLESNKLLHCGFFCHLVVEKSLKAVIAKKIKLYLLKFMIYKDWQTRWAFK